MFDLINQLTAMYEEVLIYRQLMFPCGTEEALNASSVLLSWEEIDLESALGIEKHVWSSSTTSL